MKPIETVDEALEQLATTYLLNPADFDGEPARLAGAFDHALVCMRGELALGFPFVVSAGALVLLVALPGLPLKVADGDGRLRDSAEQDFGVLIRSRWSELVG